MPALQHLAYDFYASATHRPPVIFCEPRGLSLSDIQPTLESLSISNFHSDDNLIHQLPEGLQVLRIVALREPKLPVHRLAVENLTHAPLTSLQTLYWIRAAGALSKLQELVLTTSDAPSPSLVDTIASTCHGLWALELEQALFENSFRELSYPLVCPQLFLYFPARITELAG
ncbi:hypothetical protein H0H93_002913 [Arthromyces matolae]|nr:hypothetical protein H0H93_002913 [Arthromyces matolae]